MYICLQADLSGVWGRKGGAPDGAPVAVEIQQKRDQLHILKVIANSDGKQVQQFSVSADVIRTTPDGTIIELPDETWTITASRELIIQRGADRFIMLPAQGVPQ